MVSTDVTAFQLSPGEHQVQLRRAVIAFTIGTAIEWYDFFLYSTVTGLVFAKLFFPNLDPWVGTLEAFAIYAVGFVGAAIFGHYGDRIGRKSTLIATLLLMGLATFAVALVPTYERIGIWGSSAAIFLIPNDGLASARTELGIRGGEAPDARKKEEFVLQTADTSAADRCAT